MLFVAESVRRAEWNFQSMLQGICFTHGHAQTRWNPSETTAQLEEKVLKAAFALQFLFLVRLSLTSSFLKSLLALLGVLWFLGGPGRANGGWLPSSQWDGPRKNMRQTNREDLIVLLQRVLF